jgi:hypothetical protein
MWQKLGRVYNADRKIPWRLSHAFLPTPFLLREDIVRVFVAFLDEAQIGRIGYVDVDVRDPTQVLAVSDAPAPRFATPFLPAWRSARIGGRPSEGSVACRCWSAAMRS